jgi:hypothetical protein
MKRLAIAILFAAATASAQVVAMSGNDIVVAHDGIVERYDVSMKRVWSVNGVARPARIAVGNTSIAVIDSFANELRVLDLANGHNKQVTTGETPIDAIFIDRDLFVLDRDDRRLEKIGGASVSLAADPAFLRSANGMLYVYSRLDGIVQEISPITMRIARSVVLAPFASDFETDGRSGYLVYPQEARLRTFDLATMKRAGEIAAGVVPVDVAVTARANTLSASRLVLADPSAKRVWVVEGEKSVARAVTRGFLRGLLGLGLFAPASSEFPTGVDRVATRGSVTLAYDSTTQSLYRVKASKGTLIAHGVGPSAFAISNGTMVVWQNGALRLIH